jgi:hypothetical protein
MGSRTVRCALWALVVVLLASTFASLATAQPASPNYTVSGSVQVANGAGYLRAGVTVELESAVTHQALKATTGTGGTFSFSTSSTAGALVPGNWGLYVPPQTNLSLGGPTAWAVLPASSVPTFYNFSAANLTSGSIHLLTSASLYQLSGLVTGTLTSSGNGCSAGGAEVAIVAPDLLNFPLNTTTTLANGSFSFHAPGGSWVLEASCSAAVTWYHVAAVSIASTGTTSLGTLSLGTDYAQGYIYAGAPGSTTPVPTGGNVTVYDTTNHQVLAGTEIPGFFSAGLTPSTGPWTVLVSPWNFETIGYTVSTTGTTSNVYTPAHRTPAQYNTTLDFAPGFGRVYVSTNASLSNDSVFPQLANASVGQLWSQLGLDFNGGSLAFNGGGSDATAFSSWLASQGPFWAADQADLKVNGTTFGTPTSTGYTAPVVPGGSLDYTSPNGLTANWTNAANATGAIAGGGSGQSYTISFNFRYPQGPEAINYTVALPPGYALASSTQRPANSYLVPSGPSNSWRNFTLVARPVAPDASPFGTANFTVVKFGSITAIVNVSVANFAFSKLNVINSTRANYSVVVGVGQNVTFSAINSTYPDGTNGTSFAWNFGGSRATTTQPTAYHTYSVPGVYVGSVNVTSSSGRQSQTGFTVYVGDEAPTAQITSNATAAEKLTSGSTSYLLVNWSRTLQFNISGSSSPIAANISSPSGVLADAVWSLSSYQYNRTSNYTASAGGAKVNSNFTVQLLGAGHYYKAAAIGGSTVSFFGWWYNVSLTLWDGQGHKASTSMSVLVKDTEKPVPVVTLRNARGQNVTASGLVEGSNGTAYVLFDGQYSTDPHNGSVAQYIWHVTNPANSSVTLWYNSTTTSKWSKYLAPETKPYSVNLTVVDLAGNKASTVAPLTVSVNATTRPILSASNLTAPSTMTDGSSYTIWGNVTNSGGTKSTALDVTVSFYLLKPGGTGSRTVIAGTPSSVKFYWYDHGTVYSNATATGTLPSLAYNQTVRVEISWTPGLQGSYTLYLNASATNEFVGNQGANVASTAVTLNQNPNVTYLNYAIIAAVVVVIIVGLLVYLRMRRGGGLRRTTTTTSTTRSGLERGGKRTTTSTTTEDDEDEES